MPLASLVGCFRAGSGFFARHNLRWAMTYRDRLLTVMLAGMSACAPGGLPACHAETVAVEDGVAVKDSAVATPPRGMSMTEVASHFGAPTSKVPAVGNPPISRWEYPGFVVYFEHEHVIHSVVANS